MSSSLAFSAQVSLSLLAGDKEFPLSHVGPWRVSVRQLGESLPPCSAQIVIQIDDRSKTLDVYLPNGISSDSYDVAYLKA